MIEKFKKLEKDIIVYGTGNFVIGITGVFLIPIYTRIFPPSSYGIINVLGTVASMVSIFIIMGFTTAQTFYFFDTEDKQDRCLTLSTSLIYRIFISLAICITLFVFAEPFSKYILGNADYAVYLKIVALATPLSVVKRLFINIQRMTFSKWKYLFLTVGGGIFHIILSIYLVVIKRVGLIGVFQAQLFGGIFFTLAGFFLVRKYLRFSFSFERLKDMLKYGIPLIPSGISIWVIQFADRYFLIHYSSMSDVGLYAVGSKIALIVFFVTQAFRLAWSPTKFSVAKQRDARQFYAKVLTYYLMGLSLLSVFSSLFAREILMMLTRPAYYESSKVVGLLAFAAVGHGVTAITNTGLTLTKKTQFIVLALGVAAIVNVVLNFILVPKFSIMGASLATVTSLFIANLILYITSQRYYYIPFELAKIFKILIFFVGVMIVGLLLDRSYNSYFLLIKIPLFISPIGLLFIASVIKREELVALRDLIYRKISR